MRLSLSLSLSARLRAPSFPLRLWKGKYRSTELGFSVVPVSWRSFYVRIVFLFCAAREAPRGRQHLVPCDSVRRKWWL